MSKMENNIIINLAGNAIDLVDTENFTVKNCVFYGGLPSFWRSPLEWISLKILFWKHRNLRDTTDSAVYIQSSHDKVLESIKNLSPDTKKKIAEGLEKIIKEELE